MTYKDILVYLDPSADTAARLELAVSLAAAHAARLIGIDVSTASAFEGRWRERAVGLQDLFETAIDQAGLEGMYRSISNSGSDHRYLHYADLIIAPQPEYEARTLVLSDVPEKILLTAGIPVLILPYGWQPRAPLVEDKPRTVGESIIIAWNASREATRAVHDAMPLLARARRVTVFSFDPQRDLFGSDPDFLAAHLRRHGIESEVETWVDTSDLSAVEALFAVLDRQEADLIVAGAYGHSRWLEGLFGGASKDLISQPSMPVLMSH